jgi:hypothetical protein
MLMYFSFLVIKSRMNISRILFDSFENNFKDAAENELGSSFDTLFLRIFLHKLFDAAGGIYKFLFTRKERMAIRAYFNF